MKLLLATITSSMLAIPAQAQMSFSSTHLVNSPTGLIQDNTARIFSEKDKVIKVSMLGCTWDIDEHPVDRTSLNYIIGAKQAMNDKGVKVIIAARLINGIRNDFSKPNDWCNDGDFRNVFGLGNFESGINRKVMFILRGPVQSVHSPIRGSAYLMKQDFFSPRQESEAWSLAGQIGLEIFKYWLNH